MPSHFTTIQGRDKKLSWDVHFWLGSETSTDEAGAAAIHTVQLDDFIGGGPSQHREVQDHESQLFLSYFKNGIRYEKGGVGTGFQHVEINASGKTRLFQVKGKRNVRVRQVNPSVSSMNKGDCFILDSGDQIHVYVGQHAKRVEKLKAISAANQIRDQDHNGRARVYIIDEFSAAVDQEHFFETLGSGSPSQVPEESVAEEDSAFETADANGTKLYKISDSTGKLKIEMISAKPLRQEMLETADCFILDTGSGIFVWVGRGASTREKADAMSQAEQFLRTMKYPAWIQIHRVIEGAESAPFKQYFFTWRDVGMQHTRLIRSALGYDTDDTVALDSILQNLKKSGGRAIGFMPDNSENSIKEIVQYVDEPDTNAIRQIVLKFNENIPLIGLSAYIIRYSFSLTNSEMGSIIYVWEGAKATEAVKRCAFADGLKTALNEKAILVRTVQNHEPRHLLKMFHGKLLTVFTGIPMDRQLFRLCGTDETDVQVSEVLVDSSSLDSSDVFGMINSREQIVYIWIGHGASDFEKNIAEQHFSQLWPQNTFVVIKEGLETGAFWNELNGEGRYNRVVNKDCRPLLEPRLFHCRLMGINRIKIEEILRFEQKDLDIDEIMLMDAGDELYLWVGDGTTPEENEQLMNMAKRYIATEPTDRSVDTVNIVRVSQGSEPYIFKSMFPEWKDQYWQSVSSYNDVKQKIFDADFRMAGNAI